MPFYNSCLDYITSIYCEIIDLKIGFFEDGVEDSNVWSEEQELTIYNTKTCCEVVALLQKDMRAAITQKPMSQLRQLYQSEFSFPSEECVKITSDWS